MNWSDRCREAIRRERQEVETRHGIKIGQTDIACVKCGRPWGYGKHTCQDIRLEQLNEKSKKGVLGAILRVEKDVPLSQAEFTV
jgi:predicted nucleic acid-binding Zn ribbon protein